MVIGSFTGALNSMSTMPPPPSSTAAPYSSVYAPPHPQQSMPSGMIQLGLPPSGPTVRGDWIDMPIVDPVPVHLTNVSISVYPNISGINFSGNNPSIFNAGAYDVILYDFPRNATNADVDITFTGENMPGANGPNSAPVGLLGRVQNLGRSGLGFIKRRLLGHQEQPQLTDGQKKYLADYLRNRKTGEVAGVETYGLTPYNANYVPLPPPATNPPPGTKPSKGTKPGSTSMPSPPTSETTQWVMATFVEVTVGGDTYKGIAVRNLPEGFDIGFLSSDLLRQFVEDAGWADKVNFTFNFGNVRFFPSKDDASWRSGLLPSPAAPLPGGGKRRRRTAKNNGNKRKRATTRTRGAMKLKTARKARRASRRASRR